MKQTITWLSALGVVIAGCGSSQIPIAARGSPSGAEHAAESSDAIMSLVPERIREQFSMDQLEVVSAFERALMPRMRTTPPLLAEDAAREVLRATSERIQSRQRIDGWLGKVISITLVDTKVRPLSPLRVALAPLGNAYVVRMVIPNETDYALGLEGLCVLPLLEEQRVPGFPRLPLAVGDWACVSAIGVQDAVVEWTDTREFEVLQVGPIVLSSIGKVPHDRPVGQ